MRRVLSLVTAIVLHGALAASYVVLSTGRLFAEEPLPALENVIRDGSLATAQPWRPAAPRAEISPAFAFDPQGGPDHEGALVISSDERRGLHGCWQRTFAVEGGQYYRFSSLRKTAHVSHPRRS